MTKPEYLEELRQTFGQEDGWEDSAEIALYWFANDWHNGQWSDLYSILSTSPYRPSCLSHGIDDDDDDMAAMMYDHLAHQAGFAS